MEFGLSGAIQLASRSVFRPVADRFELSQDSSNLVADRFVAGMRPAREPAREMDSVTEFGL